MHLTPDIVTLAKGITSAYFPVSASVISEKIWSVLKDASPTFGPVMHGFTYSGHPVGGALGLVNIDILEREGLPQQAAEVGGYLLELLQDRVGAHPHVGEVRGMGQMIAVEFVADKARRRFFDGKGGVHRLVAAKALEFGVLTRPLPFIEVNSFSPPLCMTRAEAEEAAERYAGALKAVSGELARLAEEA
jgi:L-2,4-diaminobutyrate transaminase